MRGICLIMCMALVAPLANAVDDQPRPLHPPIPYDLIEARIVANMERLGLDRATAEPERNDFEKIQFPLRARAQATPFRTHLVTNYIDHDAYGPGFLRDYECGFRTYDLPGGYDHAGIDYVASTFQELSTEEGWMDVVAVAGGVIIDRHDGEPDRNAPGRNESLISNYVVIRHGDGMEVFYYHLALNSVLQREIGDRVEAGEYLGRAASSGTSSEPHLHFQMHHPALFQRIVDPYGGPCSNGPDTVWQHQHAYTDPAITGIFSHDAAPVRPDRYGPPETPNFEQRFEPGDDVFASVFVRDLDPDGVVSTAILDPGGNEVATDTLNGSTYPVIASARSVFSYTLPGNAPAGTWRIRTTFAGDIRERAFYVAREPEPGARAAAAVLPGSRSVQAGSPATVFATVVNSSNVAAEGCWIGPGAPFDGQFRYRQTDPATNVPIADENVIFDIPAGGARSFVLSLTPAASAVAESYDLPLRYKCDNTDAANMVSGVNSVLMSFGPMPVPDIIAVAITPSGDGILRVADENSAAAFATAVSNVGAAGTLTVRPVARGEAASMRLRICETDPGTGACLAPATETINRSFVGNETASFAVFARAQGEAVGFSPANTRIRLIAEDADGTVRGSTSVAVRTD
jgi:murein DD-endopeptidase MepM/ murein hydrolase activator NlpD